jgi:prevent-host-death family protein
LTVVTIDRYHLVMTRVGVAELKARLSEYLRRVRRGHAVLVVDRETPVARLVPYVDDAQALVVRRPLPGAPSLQAVRLPPPLRLETDIVTLLLEERQGER